MSNLKTKWQNQKNVQTLKITHRFPFIVEIVIEMAAVIKI
jgi:hypothetical protein